VLRLSLPSPFPLCELYHPAALPLNNSLVVITPFSGAAGARHLFVPRPPVHRGVSPSPTSGLPPGIPSFLDLHHNPLLESTERHALLCSGNTPLACLAKPRVLPSDRRRLSFLLFRVFGTDCVSSFCPKHFSQAVLCSPQPVLSVPFGVAMNQVCRCVSRAGQ